MAWYYQVCYNNYFESLETLHEDVKKAMKIDSDSIFTECQEQSGNFTRWAILTSIAETEFRKSKSNLSGYAWPLALEWAKAQLSDVVRAPSETKLKEEAYRCPAYVSALEELRQRGELLDILKKVESGMWHRKSMLEKMSFRQGREEHSSPKQPSGEMVELESWAGDPQTYKKRSLQSLEDHARQVMKKGKENAS